MHKQIFIYKVADIFHKGLCVLFFLTKPLLKKAKRWCSAGRLFTHCSRLLITNYTKKFS